MNLLNQFAKKKKKQDMLSKLTENEKLHSYGYSEIHVIAAIGDLEEPNVTALAKTLRLTKGAVSKITKRLISSNVIEAYTIPDNRQKIFYRLLEKGRFLYEEHEKRHKLWLERDRQFLSQFTELQLEEFSKFMSSYNGYLEEQIRQLGGREDAD